MIFYKGWYLPQNEKSFINYFDFSNTNEYQAEQRKASLKLLSNKRVAIDIGANIGLWSRDMCNIFREVKLFEPLKLNIECLKKNLENYQNFEIFEYGLSNKNYFSNLYYDSTKSGSGTINPNRVFNKSTKVELKTLDDFEFENVDYIKIDVQFHELEVIEGSINTLKNNSPVLCIEASIRNEEERIYVSKWKKILKSLNYKVIGGLGKELFLKKKFFGAGEGI